MGADDNATISNHGDGTSTYGDDGIGASTKKIYALGTATMGAYDGDGGAITDRADEPHGE